VVGDLGDATNLLGLTGVEELVVEEEKGLAWRKVGEQVEREEEGNLQMEKEAKKICDSAKRHITTRDESYVKSEPNTKLATTNNQNISVKSNNTDNELPMAVGEFKTSIKINSSRLKKDKKAKKTKVHGFACKSCHKEFSSNYRLTKHCFEQHNVPMVCDKCGDNFTVVIDFKRHLKKKHSQKRHTKNTKEDKVPCPHCGIIYSSHSYLPYHISRAHGEHEKKKCEKCDYETRVSYDMDNHWKRQHTEDWTQTCEFCGGVFKQIKNHLKRGNCGNQDGHIKVEKFPCSQCGKLFSSKDRRKRHVKDIHDGVRNKKCISCSYATYSNSNLKLHVSKMHRITKD